MARPLDCQARAVKLHSRPPYYGAYVMLWTVLPALVLVLVWAAVEPIVVSNAVHASLPEAIRNDPSAVRSLTMGTIDAIAHGLRQLTAEELEQARPAGPTSSRCWSPRAWPSRRHRGRS